MKNPSSRYTISKKNYCNSFVSNCSLREEFIDLLENASNIFLFLQYSGALVNTFYSNY